MTPAQKRAYVLADNKLALNAGWVEQILGEELAALSALDLDFDLSVTGFSIPGDRRPDRGLQVEEPGDPEDERLPPDLHGLPVCRVGDLWRLGPHRLVCGDALDPRIVDLLMDGERARMAFTDPPYDVPIDGHVGGSGAIKHREFAMASSATSYTGGQLGGVVLADLDEAGLAATAEGMERAATIKADVSTPEDNARLVAEAERRFGCLDAALLNAGLEGPITSFDEYPLETFDRLIAVNLRGVFIGVQAAIPAKRRRGGGSIVITSSTSGVRGLPGVPGYTASKHAAIGLARSAAVDLARRTFASTRSAPGRPTRG